MLAFGQSRDTNSPTAAGPPDYDLTWHTVDGGGGTSSVGTFTLTGTVGQPDAGVMSGGTLTLAGGGWVSPGTSVVQGDCNFDGVVDLLDYAQFAQCVTGPSGPVDPACACNDLDDDDDVDLHDFGILQTLLTGS
ncbi:MAG: hypothetical protein V3W34_01670 [Phycisphaerae bacterium]